MINKLASRRSNVFSQNNFHKNWFQFSYRRTASQSTESGRVQVKQVKRKRQPNLKPANKKDGNEMKYVKDRRVWPKRLLYFKKKICQPQKNWFQSRPKVISDDVPQRRSPRNTVEAREARAQSRSLRNKELHNGGEDVCGKLSEEKQALAALFLSEINRKLSSVVWRQWINKKKNIHWMGDFVFQSDKYEKCSDSPILTPKKLSSCIGRMFIRGLGLSHGFIKVIFPVNLPEMKKKTINNLWRLWSVTCNRGREFHCAWISHIKLKIQKFILYMPHQLSEISGHVK